MAFFNKKPKKSKVYTLKEAMGFVKNNEEYSAVETVGGFKLVHSEKVKSEIDLFRQNNSINSLSALEQRKAQFRNGLSQNIKQPIINNQILNPNINRTNDRINIAR